MSDWKNKARFKKPNLQLGHGGYPKRYNHVCEKHNYSSRIGGSCPTCQQPLKGLGDRFRLSRDAKVVRKTFRKRAA